MKEISATSACSTKEVPLDPEKEVEYQSSNSNMKSFIGDWDDAPEFLKDNEFIIRGYRIFFNSFKDLIKSLFILHNESVNVWSHLLGTFFFFLIILYIAIFITPQIIFPTFEKLQSFLKEKQFNSIGEPTNNFTVYNYETILQIQIDKHYDQIITTIKDTISTNSTWEPFLNEIMHISSSIKQTLLEIIDQNSEAYYSENSVVYQSLAKWPLYIHMAGAILCLLFSSIFHLFSAYSRSASKFLSRIDYSGISILITASTFPPNLYGLTCDLNYGYTFIAIIVISSVIVVCITFHPQGDLPSCRKVRGILYLIIGISAGLPFYLTPLIKFNDMGAHLFYWGLGGLLYIIGGIIYILRIPERFKPKAFDYFGNSHNIFHFLILIAAFIHFIASIQCYQYRKAHPCFIR